VRDQIDVKEETKSFSPTGPINAEVMEEFLRLFDEQSQRVVGVDGFNDQALSNKSLELQDINKGQ
jgi:hypothetical protein